MKKKNTSKPSQEKNKKTNQAKGKGNFQLLIDLINLIDAEA